jgi:hypothetical protein
MKEEGAEARAFDPLEKLFWNDLVGVDVAPIECDGASRVGKKRLHTDLYVYAVLLRQSPRFNFKLLP